MRVILRRGEKGACLLGKKACEGHKKFKQKFRRQAELEVCLGHLGA